MINNTLIINCFGPPSAGKSTLAGGLFNMLKTADYNVEYVQEFAKTLTWEKNFLALSNQLYVSGVQAYNQNMLLGQVQAVITDSPILIGLLYYKEQNIVIRDLFINLIVEMFKTQNNINFLIKRTKKYNPSGRNQTEDESNIIGGELKKLLDRFNIAYIEIDGNDTGKEIVYKKVINMLK